MNNLLIQNGHLIDPAANIDAPRDLLIQNGRIAAIEPPNTIPTHTAPEIIDATSLTIAPGLIDLHVHLREPGQTHKETIATGTRAAAAGGFTGIVAMPNTTPVNDSASLTQWMLSPDRDPAINLFAMPAATLGSRGQTLTDFPALRDAGALGFTDDGKPILADHIMRAALAAAARVGLPISQHAEDTRLTDPTSQGNRPASMNAGPLSFRLGLRGMPVRAESDIVDRDLALLRDIERTEHLHPHLHVQHVSTARALDLIRDAKRQGLHVTCEAAPHHFTLTEDAVSGYDTNAKMNPPLRSRADRQAVIAALLDGTVDAIATDHAPHSRDEKEVEFERAPNGITGLETALGLALRVLHREHGLALPEIIALLSSNPARFLPPGHGTLAPGSQANLVLFDPTADWTYIAANSLSKSKNSPFNGAPMLGQIHRTMRDGRTVFAQK